MSWLHISVAAVIVSQVAVIAILVSVVRLQQKIVKTILLHNKIHELSKIGVRGLL